MASGINDDRVASQVIVVIVMSLAVVVSFHHVVCMNNAGEM